MSSKIQSVLLNRKSFKSLSAARRYARDHGFKTTKIDITDRYYRFRQIQPRQDYRYRTISKKNGNLKLIIAYPKKRKTRRRKR